MSVFKDGNKPPSVVPDEPFTTATEISQAAKEPTDRGAHALCEGAGLDPMADFDGRAEEYEKNWKEGQKV